MTKRYDEPFAAVRNCVARDEIRCLPDHTGQLEYFATRKATDILARVGIRAYTLRTRQPVDEQGHEFGKHRYQLIVDGHGGLLQCFKSAERVSAALSGAKTVPLTEEVVDANIAERMDMARGLETAHRARVQRAKPDYLRSGAVR